MIKNIILGIILLLFFSSTVYACSDKRSPDYLHIVSTYDKNIFYYIKHHDNCQTLNIWIYLKNDSNKIFFIPISSEELNVTLNNRLLIPGINNNELTYKNLILKDSMIARNILSNTYLFLACLEIIHTSIKSFLLDENKLYSGRTSDFEYPIIIDYFNKNAFTSINNYNILSLDEFIVKLKSLNLKTNKIENFYTYNKNVKFVVFDIPENNNLHIKANNYSIINAAITFKSNKIDIPLKYIEFFDNEQIWCNIFIDKYINYNNIKAPINSSFHFSRTNTNYQKNKYFQDIISHLTFFAKAYMINQDILVEPIISNKMDILSYIDLEMPKIFLGVYLILGFLSFLIAYKKIHFHLLIYTFFSPIIIAVWIMEASRQKPNNEKFIFKLSTFHKIIISLIFIPNLIIITFIAIGFIYKTFLDIPIVLVACLYLFINYTISYVLITSKELSFNISYDKMKFILTYFILLHSIAFVFDYYICLL